MGLLAIDGIEERQHSSETTDKLPLGFFGYFLGESIAKCAEYRRSRIPHPLGDLELFRNNFLGMGSHQRKPFIRPFLPKLFHFLSCVTSLPLHSGTTFLRLLYTNLNRAEPDWQTLRRLFLTDCGQPV